MYRALFPNAGSVGVPERDRGFEVFVEGRRTNVYVASPVDAYGDINVLGAGFERNLEMVCLVGIPLLVFKR